MIVKTQLKAFKVHKARNPPLTHSPFIRYLTDHKMRVKFNGEISELYSLIGGGPQGTLLGGIEYIVQSNDNANVVPKEDRFKYIDDLSVLQLVLLSGLLVEYDFLGHVASDVGIGQKFLPTSSHNSQDIINYISKWTSTNMMKLNEKKCSYMIFTRSLDPKKCWQQKNRVPNKMRKSLHERDRD